MRLLDTDILIGIQRGHLPAVEWFASLDELPGVPGFVAMKPYQGASDARRIREVENLLAPLAIVWSSETDCQRAHTDFRNLHLSHGLGLLDALIAATAIGQGATLVTFNARHFPRFPGSRPSKASTATVNGASWPLHQLVPGVRRDYWPDCRRRLTPHPSSGMIGCFVGWVGGTN